MNEDKMGDKIVDAIRASDDFAASDEKPTFNRQRRDERKWMKPGGKRGPERIGEGRGGKRKSQERIGEWGCDAGDGLRLQQGGK